MTVNALSPSAARRIVRGGVLATLIALAAVAALTSRTALADPLWQFPPSGPGTGPSTGGEGCLTWKGKLWDCVAECVDTGCPSQWQFQLEAEDRLHMTLTGPGALWLVTH